jgi:hypothetical protein
VPHDWTRVEAALINAPSYRDGYLDVQILATSAHARRDEGSLYRAKSDLYLFVHAYLQAAGIEYERPTQPLRVSGGGGGGAGDVASLGGVAAALQLPAEGRGEPPGAGPAAAVAGASAASSPDAAAAPQC